MSSVDPKEFFLSQNLPVFPLLPDKRPAISGWNCLNYWDTDLEEALKWKAYGIVLDDSWLVIDVDLKKGEKAEVSYNTIKSLIPNINESLTIQTPSGGYHHYFRKPEEIKIYKNKKAFPGIDFLSNGCYVVGPGSSISSGKYNVLSNFPPASIPEIPEGVLVLIQKRFSSPLYTNSLNISQSHEIQRFKTYLQSQDHDIQSQGGNNFLYTLACEGYDYGLEEEQVLEALLEWNIEIGEPRRPTEITIIAKKANSYKTGVTGQKSVDMSNFESFSEDPAQDDLPTLSQLESNMHKDLLARLADGKPYEYHGQFMRPTVANAYKLFNKETEFRDLWKWDRFNKKVILAHPAPWRLSTDTRSHFMDELDWIHARAYISLQCQFDIGLEGLREAITGVASMGCSVHPIQDWLSSLEWDGVPRFQDIIDPSEYTTILLKSTILGAVYRIFNPGYKFDYVLILSGNQGLSKSKFVKALGQEYSKELVRIPKAARDYQELIGAWFVEFPEMSAFKQSDVDEQKAFMSRTSDIYTELYSKEGAKEHPRTFVPIWTVNPTKHFIRDVENRRFLIIDLKTDIDVEWFKRNRDQIFAEAMEFYRKGVEPYKLITQIKEQAEEIAQSHRDELVDEWLGPIGDWLMRSKAEKIINKDIYENVLHLYQIKDWDKKTQLRIANCLKYLGWKRHRINKGIVWEKIEDVTVRQQTLPENEHYDV